MPGTHSKILLHVVFSTKRRAAMIKPELQPRLYDYIGGTICGENGNLYAIGGMPDHVHLLLRWRTDETVATLLRNIKSHSSGWVHRTFPDMAAFAWQEGYSVFSVSASQLETVKGYIARQREHHEGRSFEDELKQLLTAHGIEFDERYLLD